MSTSITELIGTFYEAASGKAELLDAPIMEDWDDIPLVPGQEPGRAGARTLIEGLSKAFINFRFRSKVGTAGGRSFCRCDRRAAAHFAARAARPEKGQGFEQRRI
jgi:hypothetical protein